MSEPSVTLHFHGWLKELTRRRRCNETLCRIPLTRRTSIKDLIESFGVPHTETGCIRVNKEVVTFDHIATKQSVVDIFPLYPPVNVLSSSTLRPTPLPSVRFLVDVNVAKLAAKLRMAGFDTLYNPQWEDRDLAHVSHEKQCILLTRDTMLLKRKKVTFGHLVREIDPKKQLAEIVHFYGLVDSMRPLVRCIRCNGLLVTVAKEEIENHLEPLTRRYYQNFHRCGSCAQIYWSGSHRNAMIKELAQVHRYTPLPY